DRLGGRGPHTRLRPVGDLPHRGAAGDRRLAAGHEREVGDRRHLDGRAGRHAPRGNVPGALRRRHVLQRQLLHDGPARLPDHPAERETRGGDVDNMWGPHGSERWRENDTISHPEGLRGKAVYFSSGNGEVGPEDREVYGDDLQDLAVGLVLERGVLEGTKAFERALDREGIEHRVDYAPTGLHNWSTFMRYFDEGWEHIKPALQG